VIFSLIISAITVSGVAATDQVVSAKDLIYITEQLPPYNFEKDGNVQGISVDLLEMVWDMMGEDINSSVIEVLPWSEGYQRALVENNTVLFSTGRLPEREQLFKWAGPIASGSYLLLAKKDKNINITSQEDLEKLKILAVEEDIAVQMLLDEGLKNENIVLEKTSDPIIDMLKNGSGDAWACNEITGIWEIQESGENVSDYEAVYLLGHAEAFIAFNKRIPDSLVQSFQQSIDYIMSNEDPDGMTDYEKIVAKYVPMIHAGNSTE
jgi:polar amino acid transport system substrate-binding protein